MFERFTERARQVIVLAQEEARDLKHHYIGTEHLLLGLLRENEGLAARALEAVGVTLERTRAEVVRIVGHDEDVPPAQIPFTPRAKRVCELSLREALSLGHNYIGTEHVLLGLLREDGGVAARMLLSFDADSEKIRNEVMRFLRRRPVAQSPKHTYCHCANVFRCEPATAEAQDQNSLWIPLCDRCMQIAFDAGLRVRKLVIREAA